MKHKIKSILKKLNFKRSIQLTWTVSRAQTCLTLFLLVFENVLWLGSIYMLKRLVDIVAQPEIIEKQTELMNAIIIAGLISIAYASIKSLSGYFSELQATKVNHYVDKKIHEHTINLDFSFYEDPEYLDILKRAREAGIDKPFAVVNSLFDILKNTITMATIGYLLIAIDWKLLPLLSLFVLPILIGRILFSNRGFLLYMQNTGLERRAHYLSSLLTTDVYAKEVRTFSLGKNLLAKYIQIKNSLIKQTLALSKKRTINELLTTGLGTTAFFGITAYIVFGTLQGKNTVGDIAVFLVIFPQSYSIMQALVAAITRLYQNNMYVTHIFELFDLKPIVENRKSVAEIQLDKKNQGLLISHLSFKYPHGDEMVLQNINMQIPPGKIIAIVGMNGAGKTTLIKLLCKLYEPSEGKIEYGGHDIKSYSSEQYRKQLSVVFQDFVKYNFTAAENIRFGDINSEESIDKIKEAAENAGANVFIDKFPNKYNTLLGRLFDDGHEISIGQWQKIAIARAFYNDSNIIILDEATSALDAISEAELFNSFRSRINHRSALIISHRLSTIRHADYIYVMSDKQIIESGTHQDLINSNSKYAEIFKSSEN